jgi:hypothetical protein
MKGGIHFVETFPGKNRRDINVDTQIDEKETHPLVREDVA